MRYTHAVTYDAPPAAVYAMLVDEGFQVRRARAGNPEFARAVVTPGPGDGAEVCVRRQMVVDLPGFVAKLTGGRVTLAERVVWPDGGGTTGARTASLTATMDGQPGGVTGVLRIEPGTAGTTVTLDGEITARVPLVGGRVERYVAQMLDRLMRAEHELGKAWLADDAG